MYCTITLSTLFVPISIIICFLEEPLVIILSLGLLFCNNLFITLWIFKTLSRERLGKASLILKISLMLSLDTWAYDLLSTLLTDSVVGLFFKEFWPSQDTLAWSGQNGQKNPENICLFTFRCVVRSILVWDGPIELCWYTLSKEFIVLVHY